MFEEPQVFLSQFVLVDCSGILTPRLIQLQFGLKPILLQKKGIE